MRYLGYTHTKSYWLSEIEVELNSSLYLYLLILADLVGSHMVLLISFVQNVGSLVSSFGP